RRCIPSGRGGCVGGPARARSGTTAPRSTTRRPTTTHNAGGWSASPSKATGPSERGRSRPPPIGLCVADLERSLSFYCEGLGFERAESYELDETMLDGLGRALEVATPVRLTSQMITNGELKIELLHFATPAAHGMPSAQRNQLG